MKKMGYETDCPTCHIQIRKHYIWTDIVREDCCSDECFAMYLLTKEFDGYTGA